MIRSARSPEARQRLGEVADREAPRRGGSALGGAEELVDVAAGDVGELLAALVRRDAAERADGAQQRAGQGAGADTGLDDVRAGEDVGERDDLGRVLRVDDGGAARHRDDELGEQRPEDEVLPAGRGGDREALFAPDQVVVRHAATVGVEGLARLQADVVPATLAVEQAHPLALAQRAAVDPGPRLGGDVGASGVGLVGMLAGCFGGVGHPRNTSVRRRWKALSTSAVVSTPKTDPSSSTRRYSDAGCGVIAVTRSSPAISAGSRRPSSSERATAEVATHGRRSSGVASQRRLAHDADRDARRRHGDRCCRPAASRARRTASASGRSPGTARVRRASRRATSCGSRLRSRAADIAAVAPDHRNAATTNASRKSRIVGSTAGDLRLQDRPQHGGHGGHPAGPPGDDGAAVDVAGDPPDQRLEHPTAVERQTGDEVEEADEQVGAGEALDGDEQQPVRRHEPQAQRDDADGERGQRTDDRDQELLARLAGLPLDRGHAAEEVERDRADREPESRAP